MKRHLMVVVACALLVGACGDDKKKTPPPAFAITKPDAVRVTRLAMRTNALVGRHAAIPKGIGDAPTCPITGEEGQIVITPKSVDPDFTSPAVDITFEESYDCPAVEGTILNSVNMRDDGLDFTLDLDEYREGTTAIGTVLYNGVITAETTPDGKTSYRDALDIVARSAGDTVDTVLSSTSNVTVSTASDTLALNGRMNLNITGRPPAQIEFSALDFGDCKSGPQSGMMDLAFVGIEQARIRANSCGDVVLEHLIGTAVVTTEKLTEADLESAFATSISDITNFRNVVANAEPAADALVGERWCLPYTPGTAAADLPTLALLRGFDPVTVSTDKPMFECLQYSAHPTFVTVLTHLILVDEGPVPGALADPTLVKVPFAWLAVADTSIAGVVKYSWFRTASHGKLPYPTLAEVGAFFLTPPTTGMVCNPADLANCPNATLGYRIDHFGVGHARTTPAPFGAWHAHMIAE